MLLNVDLNWYLKYILGPPIVLCAMLVGRYRDERRIGASCQFYRNIHILHRLWSAFQISSSYLTSIE